MKKKLFCVLVNVLLLLIAYVGLEYYCYLGFIKSYGLTEEQCSSEEFKFSLFSYKKDFEKVKSLYLQKIAGKEDVLPFYTFKGKEEKGVIVIGCSMAYGMGLPIEETIAYRLNKVLGKTVCNVAVPGSGLQHILYLLSLSEFRDYIPKDCEYVIYFYNPDHSRRMISLTTPIARENHFVFYKKHKDGLKIKEHVFLNESYLIQKLNEIMLFNGANSYPKWFVKLWKRHFRILFTQLKEIYPNSKLVVVKFSNMGEPEKDYFLPKDIPVLIINIPNETGIDVLSQESELVYTVDKGGHPNSLYWDIVMPIIVEKIKSLEQKEEK